MDIPRKGDQDTQLRQLQQLVHRDHTEAVNGTFDTKSWQALRAFQVQNLDQHGQPLVVDGVAGPLTWWSPDDPKPFILPSAAVVYSHVLRRLDQLLGYGHVP